MKIKFLTTPYLIKNETYKGIFRIMKICFILLFVFSFQLMALNTEAQEAVIELETNSMTVGQLIEEIEKQTDYLVVYSNREVDANRKVDVQRKSDKVSSYLDEAFAGTDIGYDFENNYIVLMKKANRNAAAIAEMIRSAQQPGKTITGKVVDVNGEPIIGANIIEVGTTNGTVSDIDGNFSLKVADNATIRISYIGYVEQEINTAGKTSFNITLVEDTQALEEVVVVGYGTMRKSDLTGAISSVTTEDIIRSGKFNLINTLQGKAAGVNIVRNNNKPGGGYSMDIRGLSSISKSNTPLVVIDGIPGSDLTLINPMDIEKIDILKDASATAIYGSRGANGVIIVTTKRGSIGKPVISYNGYFGLKSPTNRPEFMTGDEWVQMVRESYRAKNNNIYVKDEEIFTDPSELKAVQDRNYFDWVNALTRNAIQTSHTIMASGGTNNVEYSLSGGYYNEQGFMMHEDYERYNLKSSIDISTNDYLSFGGSLYLTLYINNIGNNDLFQDIHRARQTQHPYSLVTGELIRKFPSNGILNPFITQDNILEESKSLNLLGNIYVRINPIKGLEFKSSFAPYLTSKRDGRFRDTWSKALQGTSKPTAFMRNTNNYNWVWDNILNYKIAKGLHNVDFTGVIALQQYEKEELYGDVKDLGFRSLWYNLGGGTVNKLTSNYSRQSLLSYLGRFNYNFQEKYFLTLSARYDGSSKLAEGHKWSLFPSVAVAWRITEEDFMKNIDAISNLKLRVSYGETGNDSVDPYSTSANISGTKYYMFGDAIANGNVPGSLGNSLLGWETTSEYNIGLDFGLFDNRISSSIEYYNRLTKDLIMNKLIATHTGYSSVPANVGSSRNKGIEFTLNTGNIIKKEFKWFTNFTLAYNKNMIVDLAYKEDLGKYSPQLKGMQGDYSNKWFIGEPIRINWIYEVEGVWQLDEKDEAAKYGQIPGQWKVKDFDKDGTIHGDKDRTIFGKRSPDWIGGMTNTFQYNNFDFSFHMYWRTGLTDKNQFMVYYAGENNQHNFKNAKINYWTPENPTNDWAQPSNQGPYRNNASNVYTKSDFLKVSDITLGYSLPIELSRRINISSMRIYATVQNPFTITSFNGFDPENPASSIGNDSWIARTTLLGLNVTF